MGIFERNRQGFQQVTGGTDFNNLGEIINKFVPYIFAAAAMFLLLYLLLGGFGILTSKGDPKALESAKDKITNAIIGFVIIFVGYWLVQLLGLILGVSQIQRGF